MWNLQVRTITWGIRNYFKRIPDNYRVYIERRWRWEHIVYDRALVRCLFWRCSGSPNYERFCLVFSLLCIPACQLTTFDVRLLSTAVGDQVKPTCQPMLSCEWQRLLRLLLCWCGLIINCGITRTIGWYVAVSSLITYDTLTNLTFPESQETVMIIG